MRSLRGATAALSSLFMGSSRDGPWAAVEILKMRTGSDVDNPRWDPEARL